MTPAARVAAAIELLDAWRDGVAPEKLLTNWARSNRYAGSKDRAAVRDHVYQAIRCARSYAALGGAETGRGMMIGALRAAGQDPAALFSGEGYGPAALAPGEGVAQDLRDVPDAVRLDLPDWLIAPLQASLGEDFEAVAMALRHRAPVHLRVNLAKSTWDNARAALAKEGILAVAHPLSATALDVEDGARKVQGSQAFRSGLVELQDAASQAVVDFLPIARGTRVLDFCAGGGGKALAMAARGAKVVAHDAEPARMRDLPLRAIRAGVTISRVTPGNAPGGFDLVLADAPCSGSGSWRRAPQGKWALTQARLDEICAIQAGILDEISEQVSPDGRIAYATCSLLEAENGDQIRAFLARHKGWRLEKERHFTTLDGGDGFYIALLTR